MSQISFPRQFKTFFVATLKGTIRTPIALFFSFVFPVILIVIFGAISNGNSNSKFEVGLVNSNSTNPQAILVKQTLSKIDSIHLQEGDLNTLKTRIEKPDQSSSGDLVGIIELPEGANTNPINYYSNPTQVQGSSIILQTLSTLADKFTLNRLQLKPAFEVTAKDLFSQNIRYIDFALPGILGFTLLQGMVNGVSYSFLSLRKNKVLKRIFAAPTSILAFLAGSSSARGIFALAQNSVLVVVGFLLYKFGSALTFQSFLEMFVIIIFGIITFLGFGYFIAGLTSKDDQVSIWGTLLTFPQILLAGTFFPVSTLPDWVQAMVKYLPLYNFNTALRYVTLNGYHLLDTPVLTQLGILGLWCIVLYALAAKFFRIS